jgi:copper chaperone
MVTTTYPISGMTCEHCVGSVRGELEQLPGVHEVRVDLSAGTATVTSEQPLDEAAVRGAVDEAGYEVAS